MKYITETSLLKLLFIYSLLFLLNACGGGESGSITIRSPDNNTVVSGEITISGVCQSVDSVTVVIDNDAFSRQVVECSRNWSAVFDTTRFQDGDHGVVAFASQEVRDQIQIKTENRNLDGFTITAPVDLANVSYDEINEYTPLFVYTKKLSTGLITGQRFTTGTFPGTYDIPNVLNDAYEIGAILDRNSNITLDEERDFDGTAESFLKARFFCISLDDPNDNPLTFSLSDFA